MTHDLLDTFTARFPHLATRIAAVAADITEAELLLDAATDAGLGYQHFAWVDLHEIEIHVTDAQAASWLNHLARNGYGNHLASYGKPGGHVTLHLSGNTGKRVSLVILNPMQVAA